MTLHLKHLVFLWAFALGVALSYKPPHMASAPIFIEPQATVTKDPWEERIVWTKRNEVGSVTIRNNRFIAATSEFCVKQNDDGSLSPATCSPRLKR